MVISLPEGREEALNRPTKGPWTGGPLGLEGEGGGGCFRGQRVRPEKEGRNEGHRCARDNIVLIRLSGIPRGHYHRRGSKNNRISEHQDVELKRTRTGLK